MRILLLFDDHLQSTKSAPVMIAQLCQAFKNAGHEPVLMIPDCEQKDLYRKSSFTGGQLLTFRAGQLKNIGLVKRAINETMLSYNILAAWRRFRKELKIDLIVAYSPTIFWGLAVRTMKRYWKCPAYLILRDIFPQWTLDSGLLHKYSPAYWYFKFFESLNYSAYERIGVQTAGNLKYFENRRERKRVEVLNNWFIAPSVTSGAESFKKKYGLQGKVVFFYGGNIGYAQDMMNIVRLAENMRSYSQAHFLLIGKGDEWELVKQEKEKRNLFNLLLLPACSQEEYWAILQEMDIGLFSLNARHSTQNIPGKLLGYMAFQKPIVGSINPGNDLLLLFADCRAGLLSVNPDDTLFMKNAVALLESSSLRKELGQNAGSLLASQFSPDAIVRQIVETT